MNWTNYDALVAHLNRIDPNDFDYMQGYNLTEPGCVDCHCRILMGMAPHIDKWDGSYIGGASICKFLEVTKEEGRYIWGPRSAKLYGDREEGDYYKGRFGIDAALAKLAEVAGHYERPAVKVEPRTDEAFLTELRGLAAAWLKEGVEA